MDFNLQDSFGDTGLHLAIQREEVEIVSMLLQKCNHDLLDINIQNNNGETALMIACAKGNKEVNRV